MKHFPHHDETKDDINTVSVPVQGRIGSGEVKKATKSSQGADKNPDCIYEKERVGTPEAVTQQKQQHAELKSRANEEYGE